jgi:hypothetical protein
MPLGLSVVYAGQTARERELALINILGASRPGEIAAGLVMPPMNAPLAQ